MNHVTETSLVLFWLAYFGLHWWLLRTPAGDHRTPHDPMQGESSCTTPATR